MRRILSSSSIVIIGIIGSSDTVWHPINHHNNDEEWQRKIQHFDNTQTLPGFPSLKANPLLTTERDSYPKEEGTLELPEPRIPNATQYERSGIPVSEHKGPYHPALHSVHYNSNHSDEEIKDMKEVKREEGDNRRHSSLGHGGEEDDDEVEFQGETHTSTRREVGQDITEGMVTEGDNEGKRSKAVGEDEGEGMVTEGDNEGKRSKAVGEDKDEGMVTEGDNEGKRSKAVGEDKDEGMVTEGDNEGKRSKAVGEVHSHEDNSGTSIVGPQQGGVTIGGGSRVMSHGDTIAKPIKGDTELHLISVEPDGKEGAMGEHHTGHEWHPHRHNRHKGRISDRIKGRIGHDKVPKKYHPSLHHKAESKATNADFPMAPPGSSRLCGRGLGDCLGHRHELGISEVEGEPQYEGSIAEELSSLLSLWTGNLEVSTELKMINKEGGQWSLMDGKSSSSSRAKAWLADAAERYRADVNHQVESDVMLAKLITFLSLNSMGGPNDLITGTRDPSLGDLRASDSAFICNHVCWQRHPQGFARSSIKGAPSLATQCEISPMADILLHHKKPGLMRAIDKVCEEECVAMTVEENSPVSACVQVPCSERCRVEGNRCTSTLQHDWYADGFCSSKCAPIDEGKICGTKTAAPEPKISQRTRHPYDSRCLWTSTCDRCLRQEEPLSLPSTASLSIAADMHCINFDGTCRPSRGDGTCSIKEGESSYTNSSEDFFTCAAPYFEEAYPYGPYYTTVRGKPIKEVKNIHVDWNNHTVAVEAIVHNHRGSPPDCIKARYRSSNREWQSRICADHWNDRTLPWESDDRTTKGDFDAHIESMFLFKEDQNPTRPASLRVVGEVPLMKAALDRENVVHLTPDFDDYQLLLCLGPAEGYMSPLGSSALKVLGPWRLQLTEDLRETDDGVQTGKEIGDTVEVWRICLSTLVQSLHCRYLRQSLNQRRS